eukprot:sb/3461087/
MKHDSLIVLGSILLCIFISPVTCDTESGSLPHDESALDNGLGTVLFLSATFLVGAFIRHVITKFIPSFPYTVALLAIGMLIGIIFKYYEEDLLGYTGMIRIDPHLLMYTFLPVLLFESAFLLDIHAIKTSIGQILVLAIPGYLLSSLMTAGVVWFVFTYKWSWDVSMMMGAILSATDPVAVVALLKNSPGGRDVHHLSIVIEGESLLNDGAAIVLFNIFQRNAMEPCAAEDNLQTYQCNINGSMTEFHANDFCSNYMQCDTSLKLHSEMCTNLTPEQIIIDIALKTLGGPAVGVVMGYVFVYWLGKVFNDYLTEITITVGSPYLVYYVSEMFLQSSGVLSVVVFGAVVNMNKMNISPEIEAFLNKFWEQMGYLVNTIIFLVVGMIITTSAISNIEWIDVGYLLTLYMGVTLSRTIMLCFFHFVLSKMGYGSTWQSASVLMWGALRGAVSLALALQVNHNSGFCQAMRDKILFFVSGIVVLTLLVNSTTFNKILSLLGFCHVSKAKKVAVDSAAHLIRDSMTKELNFLRQDDEHTDTHWDEVKRICFIDPIYNTDKGVKENRNEIEKLHEEVTACTNCDQQVPVPLTKVELSEFYDESRNRIFKAFKISLWKQFDSGLLPKPALRFLSDACDQTLDIPDKFIELKDIEYTWKIGRVLAWVKRKLEHYQHGRKEADYPCPNNINQYKVYQLVRSSVFEIIIMFLIFINVAVVMVELSISGEKCEDVVVNGEVVRKVKSISQAFGITNFCFLAVFIFEMILKLIGQRKYYFYNKWNLIDFAIIIISIADSLSDVLTSCSNVNFSFNVFRVIRIVRLFRCVRLIKWVFLFLDRLLTNLIHQSVSAGYDIGIGFITASDEVLDHLDKVVAYKECRNIFRNNLTKTREEVSHSLSVVRKEFHGISIAVSTKHVIRVVLNKGRETAWKLQEDGLVEDFDCALFTKQLEEKMKRLLANPVFWLPPPEAVVMWSQAPWLKNLKSHIVQDVAKYSIHQMHAKGDTLLSRGEIAGGVYLIISGKARVVSSLKQGTKADIARTFSVHLACHHRNNDFLGSGSIVGEQSILVNRKRGSYVVCESDLQCYFISAENMHGLMLKYPIIEENLWRICSLRIATSLLSKTESYKTSTFEDLSEMCERSILSTLVPETNNGVFEVDSMINEIVVVYGEVRCFPTNTQAIGPKVVPHGTTKIHLVTPCKMLVILNKEYQIDLDEFNKIPRDVANSEVFSTNSGSLLAQSEVEMVRKSSVKLFNTINQDPNPKSRQEYEKKRRLTHLKDAMVANPGESTTTYHAPAARSVSPDSRLTPVED